ncbi:MAG: hypothetical protein KC621_08215 [Myxococcales bacterium]|nr:hypothetical protein [Myxococcales bacterium]
MPWTSEDESRAGRCALLVVRGETDEERASAWSELLVVVAPHVERWARRHPTLRRWRLDGPDDAREVLVRVIERLAARGRAAVGDFVERRPPPLPEGHEELARLVRFDELAADAPEATPFEAWLRVILRYAVHDHVRHRLGWVKGANRRALGSDAARIDDTPERGHRPPMTDWVTVRQQMAGVDRALEACPPPQPDAVRLWAEGHDFAEIAEALGLADGVEARRVVRAAQARLRTALRELDP